MRICFISPYSPRTVNGIGTFMMGLAKYLKEHGHEPFLITKYEDREIDINNIFDSTNIIEIKHTKLKNFANIHLAVLTLAAIFKDRHKIDILHLQQTYMLSAFSAIFGRLLGLAVVTTAHLKVSEPRNPIKKLINSLLIKLTISFSDEMVYVSCETKVSFKSSHGVVIRNGIDTDHFVDNHKIRVRMREKLDLEDKFIILFASRWTENKGIFNLIRAFALVRKNSDEKLKLVLIGSGEKDRVLSEIEYLNISNDVLPLGTMKSVYEYYCMADVFILPSQFEGLPMALLEAMSCGLPAIASRVGGNPELVISGTNGLLIEPNSIEELVETMTWCLKHKDELKMIGLNAGKKVRERFSMERVADEYIGVYRKLLN